MSNKILTGINWRLRAIKIEMGLKPDLTIDRVMGIFKQNFEYDMVIDKRNSFMIKKDDVWIGAKVQLIQQTNKTILKISDAIPMPFPKNLLLYFLAFLAGLALNIIAIILFLALYYPKVKQFLKPIEDFAKNHPEFK